MLKKWPRAAAAALAVLSVAGCGMPLESDPIYQALKANPPTSVLASKRAELRKGHSTCDVFDEGQPSKQYMLRWWRGRWTKCLYVILSTLSLTPPPIRHG